MMRRMAAARRPRPATPPRHLPRYAVIMAGGQGTRFWPRSRRRLPKQLLPITGRRTLLQETARRLVPLFAWRRVLVVTNAAHAAEVHRQLPRIPADQILVEPEGRNTLACIALAGEWIRERVGDAVMTVVPADHVIKDVATLRRTLRAALNLAEGRDCLVTLGIEPTRPETGYGYIEAGGAIGGLTPPALLAAQWVRRFHEKPAATVAKRYVASGRYLWNSGMFVWKASVFHAALELCAPDVPNALRGIWITSRGVQPRLRRAYRKLPAVSVDVGLMQPITRMAPPAPRVAVVRADFDWNDVGSWMAMPDLWGCDAAGNASLGKLVSVEAGDSIIYCPDRLVALVGVRNLIVVDSPDALLICSRERAQDVRAVTRELQRRGWARYL
jgi:mannose-1-phosphate guanylyltransferase